MARPTLQFFFGLFSLNRERTMPIAERPTTTTRMPSPKAGPAFSDLRALLNANAAVEDATLAQQATGEWRLRLVLAKPCALLRVHLDHSEPAQNGEFSAWQPRERLLVAVRPDVPKGNVLELPVMSRPNGAAAGWRWSSEDDGDGPRDVMPVASRGRFAFVCDDRAEEHLYFVLIWPRTLTPAPALGPILVDETYFRFKDAWAAEAPLAMPPRWRGR